MKCIITSAALIDDEQPRWLPGDLFDLGSHYLFNANFRSGQLDWIDLQNVPAHGRTFKTFGRHWERRGVFIIEKENIELSLEAKAYIERSVR